MTYAAFLVVFLGVPLLVLLLLPGTRPDRRLLLILAGLSAVAVVYTGPWDSAIIANGVWTYGPGRVLGVVIARVPIEEYGFYVLQVFLAGTVTAVAVQVARSR